jgi:hypothetical protein
MKLLKCLAFAALMIGSASATTYYVVGTCGRFSNPAPNAVLSGTWVCPSAASLAVSQQHGTARSVPIAEANTSCPIEMSYVFGFAGIPRPLQSCHQWPVHAASGRSLGACLGEDKMAHSLAATPTWLRVSATTIKRPVYVKALTPCVALEHRVATAAGYSEVRRRILPF